MSPTRLRIGTSGWNYPTGPASWNGLFYPSRLETAGRQRFDELAYYARFFDTVEVNSSFYRQPAAATTRRWVERTPPEFEFSVKLYQRLTHPVPVGRETGASAPPTDHAGPAPALPAGTTGDVDAFRAGVDPLADGGKLGAILVQFPPAFRMTPPAVDYLRWLLGRLRDYQVAVELRHRGWSDRGLETQAILADVGAAWTQIDEPKFRFSIRQDFRANTPGCYYVRLHGRNAASWWHPERPEDRYDYLYSKDELAPLAEAAGAAGAGVRKAYVYFNNHYSAKAVVNAAMLKDLLGQPLPGEFEPALVERYPEIRGVVRVRGPRTGNPATPRPSATPPPGRPRRAWPDPESPRLPWDTDR